MPRSESAVFTIDMKLPEGTDLLRTASTTAKTEMVIRELLGDKISLIYCHSGSDITSSLSQAEDIKGENTASLKVILKPEFARETEMAISAISNYLGDLPDLEISFKREESALQSTLGTTGAPFALEISGKDYNELERILNESKAMLAANTDLYNITTSMDEGTPEVEVAIDRFKTSYYNVTVTNIINQVKGYLEGSAAGSFEKDGEVKDVTIKLGKLSVNQLNDLMITAGSVKVPLSELAMVKKVISPREITRRNQARTCYVYASVGSGLALDKVIKNASESLKSIQLPIDYKMEFTGEELKRKESMKNLSFALDPFPGAGIYGTGC